MNPVKPLVAAISIVAVGIGIYAISENAQHATTAPLTSMVAEPNAETTAAKPATEPDDMISMVPGAIPGMMPMQVISPAIIQSVKSFHADDANRENAIRLKEAAQAAELNKNKSLAEESVDAAEASHSVAAAGRYRTKSRYHIGSRHLSHLQHRRTEKWHMARAARQSEAAQL